MSILASGNPSRFIELPHELEQSLIELARDLPVWSVEGAFLGSSTIDAYRAQLGSISGFREYRNTLLRMLNGADAGFAVVRLRNIARALGCGDHFLRLATAILAEVALPFQPFQRWPLWKELGTNLNANPGLSTGTGYNAFHMDLVNVTRPPDYTTLLCVRPDPLGAGASILSDARAAVSRLEPPHRAFLSDAAYSYGSFFELTDVGEEYTPFPILDGEPAEVGFVRFTAKMLAEPGLAEAHTHAAKELAKQLVAGQVCFTLQRGDFLIVNQHRWVHGREPLGSGQQGVAPGDRRLLLQLFLRKEP